MNKVLVVAVHPDDETIACGGTLLKHKANGDEIHWLICTETNKQANPEFYQVREKEIQQVSKMFRFDSVHHLKFLATKVDEYTDSERVGSISKVVSEVRPNIIYLPFRCDIHSDHRYIFEAAYSCTKSFRYPFVKKVLMMEAPSETEFALSLPSESFIPNVFNDISEYIDRKVEITKVYESEIGEHPFPRSEKTIRALAEFRGSTCGSDAAESFMLLKEII